MRLKCDGHAQYQPQRNLIVNFSLESKERSSRLTYLRCHRINFMFQQLHPHRSQHTLIDLERISLRLSSFPYMDTFSINSLLVTPDSRSLQPQDEGTAELLLRAKRAGYRKYNPDPPPSCRTNNRYKQRSRQFHISSLSDQIAVSCKYHSHTKSRHLL